MRKSWSRRPRIDITKCRTCGRNRKYDPKLGWVCAACEKASTNQGGDE